MSLYSQYLKEREDLETLETSAGFIAYKFRGPDCYIKEIYVLPEYRKSGIAAKMADTVAEITRSQGITILTGSVDSRANGADISEKVLRAYGMKPYTTEGFITYYMKELI